MSAVLPKRAVRAVKTEKFWQLCAGKEERYAALEPGHHTFRNKIDDRACPGEPCDERNERHKQRRARGESSESGGVATCNFPKRRSDKQGDGRGHRDGRVARTAK